VPGRQPGQHEAAGDVLPGDPITFAQFGDVLEVLVDQDGRRLPERAGQKLCLEQALVPLLWGDRLHPVQVPGL
jgi:hypothetical protein